MVQRGDLIEKNSPPYVIVLVGRPRMSIHDSEEPQACMEKQLDTIDVEAGDEDNEDEMLAITQNAFVLRPKLFEFAGR
uniref:Uncharacterized protein n=1 Tax=Angiostrongylus cantonensis TaxID=6313 RepID=A0A0K0CXL1_ANGCA